MAANDNKVIATRYFQEIMTDGNLGTLYELLAPDFIFTLPTHPEPYIGPDGFKDLVTMLHSCFPDFYIHAQDMVASDDDMVVTRWHGGGTHLGAAIHTVAGDIPASGRYFEIDGMSWHRIKNGKITEVIGHEDTIGMFKQLGVMPSPLITTTPDENLAIAKRFFTDLLNEGKFSVMDEILADDVEFSLPTEGDITGKEAVRGYVSYLRGAFSDLHFEVEREVANENKVAIRWHITGRHTGEFNGVPASGNAIDEFGIDFFDFWDGKIKAIHVIANQLGLVNQIAPQGPAKQFSPEQNNAIAVQFFDSVWNKGDFSVLETLISPDAIDHSTVGGVDKKEKGSASFRAIVSMFRAAMPDIHLTINDEIYADDKVVHRWTLVGTDTGGVMGMPPSGKQLTFTGITTARFENGLIVERWANVDELGLLQQLGVAPPPPEH